MKKQSFRITMLLGAAALTTTFCLEHYTTVNADVPHFLRGFGMALIVVGLIKKTFEKNKAPQHNS